MSNTNTNCNCNDIVEEIKNIITHTEVMSVEEFKHQIIQKLEDTLEDK